MNACQRCGQPIPKERKRYHTIFCSSKCRNFAQLDKYHQANPKPHLPTATAGAVSEYRVIVGQANTVPQVKFTQLVKILKADILTIVVPDQGIYDPPFTK